MATWSVHLAGAFKPYDAAVTAKLEAAFQRAEREAEVDIRGQKYIVAFTPANSMKQILASDQSRVRKVQRTGPPAPAPAGRSTRRRR